MHKNYLHSYLETLFSNHGRDLIKGNGKRNHELGNISLLFFGMVNS